MEPLNERQFTRTVLDIAQANGWLTAHFGNTVKVVRRKDGYATIPDKDARGFPDLVLVRQERIIFAELKAAKGRLTHWQLQWIERLKNNRNVEVYIWYCGASWQEIEEVLA